MPYLEDLNRHFTAKNIQIENKQEMMEAGEKLKENQKRKKDYLLYT